MKRSQDQKPDPFIPSRILTPLEGCTFAESVIAAFSVQYPILRIWNINDSSEPTKKRLLKLEGVTHQFDVYDFGCYIIAVPNVVAPEEISPDDVMYTARAMAHAIYKRRWTIKLEGFPYPYMMHVAWCELLYLGNTYGKYIEVVDYDPSMAQYIYYGDE